jgi:glycosyltransferase involved in cell wall biosynthesis
VPASPKISVIIPTYNRRHILPRTIASVLTQDEPDFELIVVDDCSTDDTRAYLASLTDPRIRVVAPPRNGGTAASRNLGLEAARAEVVALLDDDDIYLSRRLSAPLEIFAREPDVVATVSSSIKLDRKGTQYVRMPELKLAPQAFEWALLCDLIGIEGTSITARRADAIAIGGFRSGMKWIDDREFLIRLARRGSGWLLAETLWQKHWSDDGQSNQWAEAGKSLLDYAAACPELTARYHKLGSYFATKVLISDLRRGLFSAFRRDLRDFMRAGLIDRSIVRMWHNHVEVRTYRRSMRNQAALADLKGPPASWS